MQGKYCNREKIRLSDFDVFICFEVSAIHLCYFRGNMCMCAQKKKCFVETTKI